MKERGLYTDSDKNGINRVLLTFPDKKKSSLDYQEVTDYLKEGRRLSREFSIGQREATWIATPEYTDLPIILLLASDMHYGSTQTDYETLEKHIKIVEDTPNIFMATNGDHIDNFNAIMHASGMAENPMPPQVQARAFMLKLLELDANGKIAVLGQGNHDRFGEITGQDWFDSFAQEFQAPIFDQGGILTMITNGADYRMVLNHTYWGRSKINITNAAKRLLEYEGAGICDIAWVGHTHQSSYEHFTKGDKEYVAVVSGTYKRDDQWAAKRGIGSRGGQPGIALMLWQDKKKIEVFKDLEVAQDYMLKLIFEKESSK